MGKQVTELDKLPSFTDTSLLPVHNGAGLKKGLLSQLASYLGTKFSNPNLLINPDFNINQRDQTEYAYQTSGATKYTVDRWRVMYLNVKTTEGGILLSADNSVDEGGYFSQVLVDAVEGDTTLSFKVSAVVGSIEFNSLDKANSGGTVTVSSDGIYTVKGNNTIKVMAHLPKGSSCKIEWMKLEQGSIATPFVAPNIIDERAKCRRFAFSIDIDSLVCLLAGNACYIQNYTDIIMRTNPTVSVLYRSTDDFIVRESMNSYGTKNLGKPTSFEGLSNGRIVRVTIQSSDNSFTTMTTHDGISFLLLDAEIY